MRHLLIGSAALLVLALANAPQVMAFDTQIDDRTNTDGSPKFADPDEQLDAIADGAGGGSVYTFGVTNLDTASGEAHAVDSDRTVPWTPERIRLVFGPYAH